MNFKEGIRRLALLAGGLGATCGSFASYLELKPALQQKAWHDEFERLANSDDVKNERKCRLLGYESGCSEIKLPPNATLVAPKSKYTIEDAPAPPAHGRAFLSEAKPVTSTQSAKDTNAQIDYDALAKKYGGVDGSSGQQQSDPFADIAVPSASELSRKEIKTINWGEGKDYKVESIETEDGNTLHAISPPSRWIYLWAFILPIVGFVMPWGLLRLVQWVAAGFLMNKESN